MLTRMFKHVAAWATASFEDVILPNPKFSECKSESLSTDIAVYCIHGTADRSSSIVKLRKYFYEIEATLRGEATAKSPLTCHTMR